MECIMLVSILITNYNYSHFIEKAINSLVGQTFTELELIIIDDGSTDNSHYKIKNLQNKYKSRFRDFRYILKEQNTGKLSALNIGIPLLQGDYTIILDADDYLSRNYIEKTLNLLLLKHSKNIRNAFVYTDCYLIDCKEKIIGKGKSTCFDINLLYSESYIPECGITITKALKDALPFDEKICVGTKHYKWLKLTAAEWCGVYLPLPLFYYRMHDKNLSGIGSKILKEIHGNEKPSKILSGYWLAQT